MKALLIGLPALTAVLAATPAAADMRYWGLAPQALATGVIEMNGQRHAVRVGDPVSTWGTVHAVEAYELVVKRPLTEAEKTALRAQGKVAPDAQHMHLRNLHGMLPEVRHAP